jgi:P4 family phage/plasmid primase-like protien
MLALRNFLNQYKPTDKGETNVTALDGKWGGRWFIPNDKYDDFLRLYHTAANKDILKLAEKKKNEDEIYRLFADIDISNDDLAQYFQGILPKGFLNLIIQSYIKAITDIFEIDNKNATPIISCRLSQVTKLHLHWPNLPINNNYGKYIRSRVINSLNHISGDWSKWLDSNAYGCSGIRMLGSLKPLEKKDKRYYVINGFDDNNKPLLSNLQLVLEDIKNTSIRITNQIVLMDLKDNEKESFQTFQNSIAKPVIRIRNKENESSSFGECTSQEFRNMSKIEIACVEDGFERQWNINNYPADMLAGFVLGPIKAMGDHYSMVNRSRIPCPFKGDLHQRVSGCHHHIMGPEGTYIKCFDPLCKGKRFPEVPIPLSPDIKQILYINLNIHNRTINNNTIINKSNESSSESLTELDFCSDNDVIQIFKDPHKDLVLLSSLNGGEASMAKLLQLICGNKFYFGSCWWFWNGKRWITDINQVEINYILYCEIGNLLKMARMAYKELSQAKGMDEKIKEKIHKIDTIKKKLETRDYKRRIIEEAEWIFPKYTCIKDLENQLDTNPYLIGFPNGIFDLSSMTFRESLPQDYISIILDYEYKSEYNPDHMIALQLFLEDIMPDIDDRRYLLKLLSSGLIGKNPNELFHIFTGAGRNGKSKVSELIKLTLGDYFASISSSFLTAKISGPDQASPHLMHLKVKRLVIGSEPDHNSKLNATMIKSLSGNDEVVGRKLYKDVQSFRPFFKMILLCNNIPEIDTVDKAVWLRCRCLAFPTQFVDNPVEKHERKKDEYLSSKLPTWRLEFFHLLIKYYGIYMEEGLSITPNMSTRTGEYHVESDLYLQYLNERTESADTSIHTCILYDDFRIWYLHMHPGKPIPSQMIFSRGLKTHKIIKKNVWDGFQNKQGVEGIKLLPKFNKPEVI